ncbi:hypothetical protein EI546_06600 [Aequorivita sp. H23M31]|uniref:Uncharacterized protein n=1 Tax=Aequorivita ciconiae TaxID=2494375 RepID=A0A410G2E2_9FLAO|nr:hypothetical protein [Aequorivita sp. H23M31]QAA81419.1 hypothetical protein EI546_06600 [Aequorivita sp. H23M31]
MKTTVLYNQCLQDITIREMGGLEGIFDMALLNGFSITEDLSGLEEILTPRKMISAGMVRYYRNKMVQTATDIRNQKGGNTQHLFENGLFENGLFE